MRGYRSCLTRLLLKTDENTSQDRREYFSRPTRILLETDENTPRASRAYFSYQKHNGLAHRKPIIRYSLT